MLTKSSKSVLNNKIQFNTCRFWAYTVTRQFISSVAFLTALNKANSKFLSRITQLFFLRSCFVIQLPLETKQHKRDPSFYTQERHNNTIKTYVLPSQFLNKHKIKYNDTNHINLKTSHR